MPENSARKPPTDFTIDCILSKSDHQNVDLPKSSTTSNHPMNKVLDNPWTSRCLLSFKPSLHRKLSFPSSPASSAAALNNSYDYYTPPSYTESFLKVTQHFTSVHNHFYPVSASDSSNSNDFKLLPKSIVYDCKPCDSEILRNNLSLNFEKCAVKIETLTSSATTPNANVKCSVCSKTFENRELLDVRIFVT